LIEPLLPKVENWIWQLECRWATKAVARRCPLLATP